MTDTTTTTSTDLTDTDTTTTTTEAPAMTDTDTTTTTTTTQAAFDAAPVIADLQAGNAASYVAASPADRKIVRTDLDKIIAEALRTRQFDVAGSAQDAVDLIAATKITKGSAKIVPAGPDYAQVIFDRITDLRRAADLLATGTVTPDGITLSTDDRDRLRDLVAGSAVDAATWNAFEIAGTRVSTGTRSDVRTDLDAHVAEVIAQFDAGTFLKISTVANTRTVAAPNGLPSQGALAARLTAKGGCTLAGVAFVDATATSPKGLRVL